MDWEEGVESVVEELDAAAEVANVHLDYGHYLADYGSYSALCFVHCQHGDCHAETVVGREKDDIAAGVVAADAGIDYRLFVSC